MHRAAATAIAVGLLLVACTSEGEPPAADGVRVVQPGAPGEPNRELSPEEIEALDLELEVEHTDADVRFMQDMIPHHVQALRMTSLVDDRRSREDLSLFAERMEISQEGEIALIQEWLEVRDEPVPSLLLHDHGEDQELMPGMLTEDELLELDAAEGEAFDRLFLESMIRHHQGAIAMVETLYADGGGREPGVAWFAQHVVSDQQTEIARMRRMLAEMDDTASG